LAFRRLTGDGSSGLMGDECCVAGGSSGGFSCVADAMMPTPAGVGVNGGGLMGEPDVVVLRFLGNGVNGRDVIKSSVSSAVCGAVAEALVLRFFAAGATLSILVYFATPFVALGADALLLVTRVDRLRDMMGCLLLMRRVV
jgi:hypothetical protein